MTGRRFSQYSACEEQVFKRFLDAYDNISGFRGIKAALQNYEMHPEGIEDYDVRVSVNDVPITFDVQESRNFSRYGDLRIDYVSVFKPADYWCSSLQQFQKDEAAGGVVVEKWGKGVNPLADFLVVEFHNGKDQWQVYHIPTIRRLLPELGRIGYFKINDKDPSEDWGSAFLAVKETHPLLQRAKPKTLNEVLTRTLQK